MGRWASESVEPPQDGPFELPGGSEGVNEGVNIMVATSPQYRLQGPSIKSDLFPS